MRVHLTNIVVIAAAAVAMAAAAIGAAQAAFGDGAERADATRTRPTPAPRCVSVDPEAAAQRHAALHLAERVAPRCVRDTAP